jgi:hypothetical protein
MKLTIGDISQIIKEYLSRQDMEDVEQTARLVHMGQKRRDNTPYITHPIAVFNITKRFYPEDKEAQMLALLHDTLEDTEKVGNLSKIQAYKMIQASIHDKEALANINVALGLLTHDKSVPYPDYLQTVLDNPLAAKVKISDLIHNLSHNPSSKQIIKYGLAMEEVFIPAYVSPTHLAVLKKILKSKSELHMPPSKISENKRVPRKKGQHRNSPNHSDLFTDENKEGTIPGLKFATVKDAKASVNKIKKSNRTHNHKTQAAIAMEQRAETMNKKAAAGVFRSFIEDQKEKTKQKNKKKNESLLRSVVREILLERREDQDSLDQLVHNRENQPYSSLATNHREREKQINQARRNIEEPGSENLPTDEEIDAQFEMRRDVKKFWNENADHKYWQNPQKVIAIHDLSYYAEFSEEDEDKFTDDLRSDTDLKIEAFLKRYPPGQIQKDEMSAYGFTSMDQFLDRNSSFLRISLGIIMNPRRVTYASLVDAYTESRGSASERDIERHKGSGLPKRPSVPKRFEGRRVLFDEQDVQSSKAKTKGIGELIVDNWSYDTLVINTGYNKYFSVKRVKQIIKTAKEMGLKVIDGYNGEEL